MLCNQCRATKFRGKVAWSRKKEISKKFKAEHEKPSLTSVWALAGYNPA